MCVWPVHVQHAISDRPHGLKFRGIGVMGLDECMLEACKSGSPLLDPAQKLCRMTVGCFVLLVLRRHVL